MSAIRACDKCRIRQKKNNKDSWVSVSIHTDNLKKIIGLESNWVNLDFCSSCGEKLVKKFTQALKNST